MKNRAIYDIIGLEHLMYGMSALNCLKAIWFLYNSSIIGSTVGIAFTGTFLALGNKIKQNKHIKRCKNV